MDLWHQLDELIDARPSGTFLITKVTGHATAADVAAGRAALQDKMGNDAADALAVAGQRGTALSQERLNISRHEWHSQ